MRQLANDILIGKDPTKCLGVAYWHRLLPINTNNIIRHLRVTFVVQNSWLAKFYVNKTSTVQQTKALRHYSRLDDYSESNVTLTLLVHINWITDAQLF